MNYFIYIYTIINCLHFIILTRRTSTIRLITNYELTIYIKLLQIYYINPKNKTEYNYYS